MAILTQFLKIGEKILAKPWEEIPKAETRKVKKQQWLEVHSCVGMKG